MCEIGTESAGIPEQVEQSMVLKLEAEIDTRAEAAEALIRALNEAYWRENNAV